MRTRLRRESRHGNPAPREFDVRPAGRSAHAPRAAKRGHSLSDIRILPERSDARTAGRVRLADEPEKEPQAPAPPAPAAPAAPAAAAPDQQAAPAIKPPVLESGEIEIKDDGNSFKKPAASVPAFARHDVGTSFTVKTKNVKVQADSPGEFVFGLVQNVLFDHFEATYSKGDMLVDVVGPLLDIWPTHPAPFFHEGGGDNPAYASSLFTQLFVSAQYTDTPGWPLEALGRFCDERVWLRSATRSIMFRVGLVARHVQTGQLFQLAAANKSHSLKWRADIKPDGGRSLKSDNKLQGTYALDKPGVTLKLAAPTAVNEVNDAMKAAEEDMATRCENVL